MLGSMSCANCSIHNSSIKQVQLQVQLPKFLQKDPKHAGEIYMKVREQQGAQAPGEQCVWMVPCSVPLSGTLTAGGYELVT